MEQTIPTQPIVSEKLGTKSASLIRVFTKWNKTQRENISKHIRHNDNVFAYHKCV